MEITTHTTVEGVDLVVAGDDLKVHDLVLAALLEMSRPRDIRPLIKRYIKSGDLQGVDVRETVSRTSMPKGGTRETKAEEFHLTEEQALFIIAKSETPVANEKTRKMIRVFMLARRGLLTPTPSPEPALVARVAQLEASNAQILAAFATLPAALAQAVEGAVERAVKAIVPVLPPAPDVSCIGPHGRRHIMASLRMYGRLMTGAKGGLTENQWTRKGEQDLRAALGFAGTGRRWELFPMTRFGEIQSHMDQLLNTARGVAGDRQAGAQLPLAG